MIRSRVTAVRVQPGWFYEVFDTEQPEGSRVIVSGARRTWRHAMDAAIFWLRKRS